VYGSTASHAWTGAPRVTVETRRPGGALLFVVASILLLAGCGYHRAERGAALPDWIRTIYVAPLANQSNELLLGSWITDDLRREFLRGSGLRLVREEEADVLLEGKVVGISTGGLSYLRYDQAVERRIAVECEVRLKNRNTGETLWESGIILREEGFLVGRDIMATEGLKQDALRKISLDVADLVYHRVTQVF